jgi:hypothetical protein
VDLMETIARGRRRRSSADPAAEWIEHEWID